MRIADAVRRVPERETEWRTVAQPLRSVRNGCAECFGPVVGIGRPLEHQFVKHQLKAQRYLRYVDDFILVHHNRQQLVEWQQRIEAFLADRLALRLKAEIKLAPLSQGIDFLGYVVRPTHTLVLKRVVQHAREKLFAWQQQHVSRAGRITASAAQRAQIRTVIASYAGHFHHANAYRLRADFRRRNPWLAQL